jgi:hypothetical protein
LNEKRPLKQPLPRQKPRQKPPQRRRVGHNALQNAKSIDGGAKRKKRPAVRRTRMNMNVAPVYDELRRMPI